MHAAAPTPALTGKPASAAGRAARMASTKTTTIKG